MSELLKQIRQAVAKAKAPRAHICRETGISESSMSQFMAGTKGLRLEVAERLARHLGYQVKLTKRKGEF